MKTALIVNREENDLSAGNRCFQWLSNLSQASRAFAFRSSMTTLSIEMVFVIQPGDKKSKNLSNKLRYFPSIIESRVALI